MLRPRAVWWNGSHDIRLTMCILNLSLVLGVGVVSALVWAVMSVWYQQWWGADTDSLQSRSGPAAMGGAAEYYTKDEMAAFSKPKRRVKKKLRKKAAPGDDEDTAVSASYQSYESHQSYE